jgi:hypothetical protein
VVVWARIVLVGSTGTELAEWVVEGVGAPDLAVVEAVARWQLWARRAGGAVLLRDVGADLLALLDLAGLLGEMGGEPEGRKQVLGVEEGVVPGDPVT